jgi:hypothetical protein
MEKPQKPRELIHMLKIGSNATLCGARIKDDVSNCKIDPMRVTCQKCLEIAGKAYGMAEPEE